MEVGIIGDTGNMGRDLTIRLALRCARYNEAVIMINA
jgi:hypothetical protein